LQVALRLFSLVLVALALMLLGADAVTSLDKGGEITVRSVSKYGRSSVRAASRYSATGRSITGRPARCTLSTRC